MHDAPTGLSRHVRTLADRMHPGRPDGELLAAWHARRDEAAFAEMVRRHGRLVWGVCRRATADADDAYQAVFLLLAARAGRLRGRATVAPWLYGTAVRVARRAARTAARRRAHERRAAKPEAAAAVEPADWRPAFDAVLAGLPARYRDAVVLCELGGLPRAAAAERLNVSVGTLASRLAAARVLLRRRLLRRGVTAWTSTVAGVPPAVTAGVASAAARRLTHGVVAMATSNTMLAVVLTAGGVAATAAWVPVGATQTDPPGSRAAEAAWLPDFQRAYSLAPGQAVRHVPRPFPRARGQFWEAAVPAVHTRSDRTVGDDKQLLLGWERGRPLPEVARVWGWSPPRRPANTVAVRELVQTLCQAEGYLVETGGPSYATRQRLDELEVGGDFVYDPASAVRDRATALDSILHDQLRLPVRVRAVRLDRPMLVVGGRYAPTPRLGRAAGQVDVFGRLQPERVSTEDGAGDLTAFLTDLARWVGRPVADEVTGSRPDRLRWHMHRRQENAQTGQRADGTPVWNWEPDRDPTAVAATVAAQTGFDCRVEQRTVEIVLIEPAGPPK